MNQWASVFLQEQQQKNRDIVRRSDMEERVHLIKRKTGSNIGVIYSRECQGLALTCLEVRDAGRDGGGGTSKANTWPAFLRDAPVGKDKGPGGLGGHTKGNSRFSKPNRGPLPAWNWLRTEIGSALELSLGSRNDIFTTTRGFIHSIFKLEAT